MNQVENIKFTSATLKDIELTNLGKINIICGKNNSGKSTLLRNIQNEKNRKFGIILNADQIHKNIKFIPKEVDDVKYDIDEDGEIHEQIIYTDGNCDEEDYDFLEQAKNIFVDLANKSQDKIFWGIKFLIKDAEKLAVTKGLLEYDETEEIVALDNGNITQFDNKHIITVAKTIFNEHFKTIYIPAKRNPAVSMSTSQTDTQDVRFLTLLFELKNSLLSDTNRAKYEELGKAFYKVTDGYYFDVNFTYLYSLTDKSFKPLKTVIKDETLNELKKLRNKEFSYQDFKHNILKIVGYKDVDKVLELVEKEQKVILSFSKDEKVWFPAMNAGEGYRDLLYMLTYAIVPDYDVLLIEEPENHISPDIQRKLLQYFKDHTEKQYFIATHSSIFLDNSYADTVFHIQYKDRISVENLIEKANLLKDLGYLAVDNLYADVIVLVEGSTDVNVLDVFIKTLGFCIGVDVKFLPLGGIPNMPHVKLEDIKAKFNKTLMLVDGDTNNSSIIAKKELQPKCSTLGIKYTELRGYGIENYFTINALKQKYSGITITAIQLDKKLEDQLQGKISKTKLDNFKKEIRSIATYMTEAEIKATGDLYDFLKELDTICKEINN